MDASKAMVELSSGILGALPNRIGEGKLEGRAYQLAVPASDSALAKMRLGRKTSVPGDGGMRTVAIAAFSLGDLGTKERRKDVVRCMWASGAEVIVVVERGTPGGSRMVLEAREQLLSYGRKTLGREETVEGEVGPEKGCFVLAPVSRSLRSRTEGGLTLARSVPTTETALFITRPNPTATFRSEVRIPLADSRSQADVSSQFAPLLSSATRSTRLAERTTPSFPTSLSVAAFVPPVAHLSPARKKTRSRACPSSSWTLRSRRIRSRILQKGTSWHGRGLSLLR